MDAEGEDQLTLLSAKVVVLEILLRAFITDRFKRETDPVQSAKDAAIRAVDLFETQGNDTPAGQRATMVLLEQVQTFFDRIVRDLESNQRGE